MINTLFDKTYLINLDKRKDRLEQANTLTEKFNFEFTRFQAVDGEKLVEGKKGVPVFTEQQTNLRFNKYSYALNLTIAKILKEAIKNNYSSILICEDDVMFKDNYSLVFEDVKTNIPKNWDLFYFGCMHLVPYKHFTNTIGIVRDANLCHCFAINSNVFERVLTEVEKNEKPIDIILRETVQRKYNSYCVYPNLAYQVNGITDIGGGIYKDSSFSY